MIDRYQKTPLNSDFSNVLYYPDKDSGSVTGRDRNGEYYNFLGRRVYKKDIVRKLTESTKTIDARCKAIEEARGIPTERLRWEINI